MSNICKVILIKNRFFYSFHILFLILLLSFVYPLFGIEKTTQPIAENGIIDLRHYTFENSVFLKGEWIFTPDSGNSNDSKIKSFAIGRDWNPLQYNSGTYSITLKFLPSAPETLAIKVPELNQHISISINNTIVYETGSVEKLKQNSSLQIIPFKPFPTTVISIYYYNKYNYSNKNITPIELGLYTNIIKKQYNQGILKSTMIGFLLFIFCFFLFLYITKYPQIATLYLSLIALLYAIRFSSGDELIYSFFSNFSVLKYKIFYITTFLGSIFSLLFLDLLLKIQSNKFKNMQEVLIILGILLSCLITVLPIRTVSILIPVYLIYAIISLLFILVESIFSLKQKSISRIIAITSIILPCILIFDFVFTNKNYHLFNINITDISLFTSVLFFAFAFSYEMTISLKNIKNLSAELEREVVSRTYELNNTIKLLRQLSSTDELTGIYNLRKFTELGEREINIHLRHKRPLSLIMFDIDSFKNINDTYGHKVGDLTLKFLTSTCRQEIRGSDILGRIGGDEFALFLLETTNEKAALIAENLRHTIHEGSKTDQNIPEFTISLGVITFRKTETLDMARQRVDACLYKAKNSQRNMVYTQTNDVKNQDNIPFQSPDSPELLSELPD